MVRDRQRRCCRCGLVYPNILSNPLPLCPHPSPPAASVLSLSILTPLTSHTFHLSLLTFWLKYPLKNLFEWESAGNKLSVLVSLGSLYRNLFSLGNKWNTLAAIFFQCMENIILLNVHRPYHSVFHTFNLLHFSPSFFSFAVFQLLSSV